VADPGLVRSDLSSEAFVIEPIATVRSTRGDGVTVCRILDDEGSTVRFAGLDAIDGTPVVDIKPWMSEFGPRGDVSQPSWSTELMTGYW
jgi:hypothetical protein